MPPPLKLILTNKPPGAYSIIYGILKIYKYIITVSFPSFKIGLSVDWLGRNIYWTDSTDRSINVGDLDGRYKKTLFSSKVNNPRGIVCHPYKG